MESFTINGVNIIRGEIYAMLTLMRANSRWSISSTKLIRSTSTASVTSNIGSEKSPPIISSAFTNFELDDIPLAQSFRMLSEYLDAVYDLQDVDMDAYISPFHGLVVSDQANGPLTYAALSSLVKFGAYGFLSSSFPKAKEAIGLMADCAIHCIFEATDWESDELILMKLLELSTLIFKCDASKYLSVESAYGVYSTCLSLQAHYQAKLMQFEAELALRNITTTVFSKVHSSNLPFTTLSDVEANFEIVNIDTSVSLKNVDMSRLIREPEGIASLLTLMIQSFATLIETNLPSTSGVIFGLTLLNKALESGGSSLGSIPNIIGMFGGIVCRHLFKAAQSDNFDIFSLALRVAFNLFVSVKSSLKVQLEAFLSAVHIRILNSPQNSIVSMAKEELVLESLLEFCREPSLMQDIYVNYDCDVNSSNLFNAICSTLCQRALPEGFSLTSMAIENLTDSDCLTYNMDTDLITIGRKSSSLAVLNRLAFEGIYTILRSIALRCLAFGNNSLTLTVDENVEDPFSSKGESDILYVARVKAAEIIRNQKLRKEHLRIATEKFNVNSLKAEWLQFALDNGLIIRTDSRLKSEPSCKNSNLEMSIDPKSVAIFLRTTPGLSKTQIGVYIGKGPADLYPFHAAVLKEYVSTFQFEGKYCAFDSSLRLFLGQFLLPGEAQCIDRIMEAFAGHLFKALGPGKPFANGDSAFILAFSTIMLNTDQHNPQIPVHKKMTKEQFVKNNRGINDGKDLPREYLEELYDEIKNNQIRIDDDNSDSGRSGNGNIDYSLSAEWGKYLQQRQHLNQNASFTPASKAKEEAKYAADIAIFNNTVKLPKLTVPITYEKDMFLIMSNQMFEVVINRWTYVIDDNQMNKLVTTTCDFLQICASLHIRSILGRAINALSKRAVLLMEFERQNHDSELIDGQAVNILPDLEMLKRSLDIFLKTEWDSFHRPQPRQVIRKIILNDASLVESTDQTTSVNQSRNMFVSWIGSSKIRGEILLKILFHFTVKARHLIPHDSWSALVDILRFSRLHGVLPSTLSNIRTQYENLVLDNSKFTITLPLTTYAIKCIESFRMKNKSSTINQNNKKPNDEKKEMKQSSSFWNLLWSDTSEGEDNQKHRNNRQVSTPRQINQPEPIASSSSNHYHIGNIHDLLVYISNEEYTNVNPSSDESSHVYNNHNKLVVKSPESFHGNIIDAYRGGNDQIFDINYDLLRSVLDFSNIDKILFVTDEIDDGITVVSIFDALMKALTDILNLILSIQNQITVTRLQVDAVMLLEWMTNMIQFNPKLVSCLWNKLHRSIYTMVFEVELTKIMSRAPFFLERCVVTILYGAGSFLHPFVQSTESSNQQSSSVDAVWSSLRLLKVIPSAMIPELRGRLSIGLLYMIRVNPTVEAFESVDQWNVMLHLLSKSTNSNIGRVFAWESLSDIMDNNAVYTANFLGLRSLICQYVYGDFHGRSSEDDAEVDYYVVNHDNFVIDRSLPWLPYVMMHLLKLTLMVLMATTTETDSVINIPLPPWPDNQTKEEDRVRIVYLVTAEEKSDARNHRNSTDQVDENESSHYYASHLTVKPLSVLPRADVEQMWIKSCSVMSRLVDSNSSPKVSKRALFCLQALIEAGNDSDMAPSIWWTLLSQLIQYLPLKWDEQKVLSSFQDQNLVNAKYIDRDEDICLRCAVLIFDIIIHHIRDIQLYPDFSVVWLDFVGILSYNISVFQDSMNDFKKRMIDMVIKSLRLLVSILSTRRASILSDSYVHVRFSRQGIDSDDQDGVDTIDDGQGNAAPEGLFQFVTELLGFTGTPYREKLPTVPQNTPATTAFQHHQSENIPELTAKAMDLSNSNRFSTPSKKDIRAIEISSLEASAVKPTEIIDVNRIQSDVSTASTPRSSFTVRSVVGVGEYVKYDVYEKLLNLTWQKIIGLIPNFRDLLISLNPKLLDELRNSIDSTLQVRNDDVSETATDVTDH